MAPGASSIDRRGPACLRSASCTVAVMCRPTASEKSDAAPTQSARQRLCRKRAVSVDLLGASKTWRLPSMWPITKMNRMAPVTAMTIFLPVVERQKLTTRFSRRLTAVVLIEIFQP